MDKPISVLLKLLRQKVKDVPKLKAEIAEALSKVSQRFLFVIDDIDRLTPDEIRELFKVIKALADFPKFEQFRPSNFDQEYWSEVFTQGL